MDFEMESLNAGGNVGTVADEFENEVEFLTRLLSIQDFEVVKKSLDSRILELQTVTDYAGEYSKMKPRKIAFKRFPAITATICFELIVGLIVSEYSHVLEKHILLTSFLPVLSALGGNLGLQASTTTLRALTTRHESNSDFSHISKIIIRETTVGAFIGSFSGFCILIVGLLWSENLKFAYTTSISVFINCTIGACIGSLSPVLFAAMAIDPALMTGPLETAVQDIIGTTVYLTLANYILA